MVALAHSVGGIVEGGWKGQSVKLCLEGGKMTTNIAKNSTFLPISNTCLANQVECDENRIYLCTTITN